MKISEFRANGYEQHFLEMEGERNKPRRIFKTHPLVYQLIVR